MEKGECCNDWPQWYRLTSAVWRRLTRKPTGHQSCLIGIRQWSLTSQTGFDQRLGFSSLGNVILQGFQSRPGGEVRRLLESSFPWISLLLGVTPQMLDLGLAGEDYQAEGSVNIRVVELHPDVLQDEKTGWLRTPVCRLEVEEEISP